jgi:hypothetical protein
MGLRESWGARMFVIASVLETRLTQVRRGSSKERLSEGELAET